MKGPHNILRLVRTAATFERTGAAQIALDAAEAPRWMKVSVKVIGWPFKWLGYKGDPNLPPLTRAITALGPAYIKFGQILSTRPDVVGVELADQLRMLQDRLPPFPTEAAKRTIEAETGKSVDLIFDEFSPPVAAASIAQVHCARRADNGERVAVKVLRPNIDAAFRKDIDAFHFAAATLETISPASRRLRPRDVVNHFESVVNGELDLRLEAASASQFAENTAKDPGISVPLPVWPYSGRRVLTSDWAEGLPMGDVAALHAAGYDTVDLGQRVLQMFLTHALRDGYFHGDMHQGNLKVAPNGDIVVFDFGIMGQIDAYTRRIYAEILMGFIRRDYDMVARVHFEAGYVPADRDRDAFARALRAVGEPIFGADASQISMSNLLGYLFEVTERFGMRTRTELILLQRTMVVVEGVARSLDPQINIWQAARPVVEAYVKDNLGPRALMRDGARILQAIGRFGPLIPEAIETRLGALLRPEAEEAPKPRGSGVIPGMVAGAVVALVAFLLGAWLAS